MTKITKEIVEVRCDVDEELLDVFSVEEVDGKIVICVDACYECGQVAYSEGHRDGHEEAIAENEDYD